MFEVDFLTRAKRRCTHSAQLGKQFFRLFVTDLRNTITFDRNYRFCKSMAKRKLFLRCLVDIIAEKTVEESGICIFIWWSTYAKGLMQSADGLLWWYSSGLQGAAFSWYVIFFAVFVKELIFGSEHPFQMQTRFLNTHLWSAEKKAIRTEPPLVNTVPFSLPNSLPKILILKVRFIRLELAKACFTLVHY